MTDQQPTSNGAKAASAGVGAALILALSLLLRRHGSNTTPLATTTTAPPPAVSTAPQPTAPIIPPPVVDTNAGGPPPRQPATTSTPIVAPNVPPVPDEIEYGPITAAVDVPPAWIDAAKLSGCIGVDAMWNPAAHGVDWNTSPDTIRQRFSFKPDAITADGKLPLTLTTFPHDVVGRPVIVSLLSCRFVTVPKPGFSGGVLHAMAASTIVPAPRTDCGLTYTDENGRAHPLVHCTVEEMLAAAAAARKEQ